MVCLATPWTVTPVTHAQLESEWRALARSIARPVPFDHPDWHAAWWSRFGNGHQPVTLAIRCRDELAGVVPLMREGTTLRIAGDAEICDYAAPVITAAYDPSLLSAGLDAAAALEWQTLHLWGMPEDSPAIADAVAWANSRGYAVEVDYENVCPRVPLSGDWDAYLGSLTKKDRHELRRKLRRFEAGGAAEVRCYRTPEAINQALDTFFHLLRISRRDKSEFLTPAMEGFFREMATALAADDWVRLYEIRLNAAPVAALLGFVTGDEFLLYNSGYDPAMSHLSVGLISKALAIQATIADGRQVFDFLRGAEPYKRDLGGVDRIVRQMWIRRDD